MIQHTYRVLTSLCEQEVRSEMRGCRRVEAGSNLLASELLLPRWNHLFEDLSMFLLGPFEVGPSVRTQLSRCASSGDESPQHH